MPPQAFDIFGESKPQAYTELRDAARSLYELLERSGVRIPPGSRLQKYLTELNTICAAASGEGSKPIDIAVWHRALIEIDDFRLIVGALTLPNPLPGWEHHVHELLSGAALPQHEQKHSKGRNTQFELLVASTLRRAHYEVVLAEPDVIVTSTKAPFGIAAKRPRSWKNLSKNLQDADGQIERTGLDGIVAIDISVLINPSDRFLLRDDLRTANRDWARGVDQFIHKNAQAIRSCVDPSRTFGVAVYAAILFSQQHPPQLGYLRRWSVANLCALTDPRAKLLATLATRVGVESYLTGV
jgi:hypothetical protein